MNELGARINNLALVSNSCSFSYLKIVKDNRLVLVLDYLYSNQVKYGNLIKCCLEDIILYCGFKVDRHKGATNDKFKLLLHSLQELEIISCSKDLSAIKSKEFIVIEFNGLECSEKGYTKYFYLDYKIKNTILSYNKVNIDNLNLLNVYCYLLSKINVRSPNDVSLLGGLASFCYPSYDEISSELLFDRSLVSKYIKILKELKLIKYDNLGVVRKGSETIKANNVYVLCDENSKFNISEGLKMSKLWYEENGYKVNN